MEFINKITDKLFIKLTPEEKAEFDVENRADLHLFLKYTSVFGVIATFGFLSWDFDVADPEFLSTQITLRLVVAVIYSVTGAWMFLIDREARHIIKAFILTFICALITLSSIFNMVDGGFTLGAPGIIIFFAAVIIFPFFYLSLVNTLIIILVPNIMIMVLAGGRHSPEPIDLMNFNASVISFGVIALLLAYLLEQKRRSTFLLKKDLEEQKLISDRDRKEAEQASKAKSEFLATMSHEVRTPLNGILGMANLMQGSALDSKQAEYLDTIRYSGETLLTMLNDILDYSKMDAGKFEIETMDFDLDRLVKSVANIMRSRAEEKGINVKVDVKIDVPQYINSDPTRLRQVILNLLSNAIKFTDEGSVSILVSNIEEEGDEARLRFEVSDTGIGIPEDARDDLFKEFVQADSSTSRKYGGTGLGLSICRHIVGLLEGEIGVESKEDEGSTFWFEIPVMVADYFEHEFEADAESKAVPDMEPLLVLLVDDNDINLKVGRDILQKYGHDIVTAQNGQEAVDAVKDAKFDVILMDMQMPVMDGLEATREIKAMNAEAAKTPIIALTANSLRGDDEICMQAGMADHVPKPFDPDDLIRTIARHCPDKVKQKSRDISLGQTKFSEADSNTIDLTTLKDLEEMFDRNYVLNFLQEHIADIAGLVESIENEFDENNMKQVHHYAHELKSLSSMFGMMHLSHLVSGIEACCLEGREVEIENMVGELSERYANNLEELQKFYPIKTGTTH